MNRINKQMVDSTLSEKEVEKIAEETAKALGSKFSVTKGSIDNRSFSLDYDGVKYDGGSYLIMYNGDIVNVAIMKAPIYYNYKTKKKYEFGGDFQSGVYEWGGRFQTQDTAEELIKDGYGIYEAFESYKDAEDSCNIEDLRSGKVIIVRINNSYCLAEKRKMLDGGDFQSGVYANGGSLEAHGIKEGDTFLRTISGSIQKVKDKNGNIFYINLATGERDKQPPLPFDNGGEVKYFINKDGIKVRSVAKPEKKLTEAEWMAKHNESKEARGYESGGLFGFGGMFSKAKESIASKKYPKLEGKQVMLKSGKYVQVFEQDGSKLQIVELGKIGSGEKPQTIDISEVDTTSFAGGGKVKKGDVGKSGTQYGYTLKEWEEMAEKKGLLVSPSQWWKSQEGTKYKDSFGRTITIGNREQDKRQEMESYGYRIAIGLDLGSKKIPLSAKNYVQENNFSKYANGGGVGLIGNQKRIDMNKNGKIDAEDFKLLRSSMNGAWRNERKHVNHNEDYEVRYARKKPARTGYKGKRNFEGGGGVSKFKMLSDKVARNYEGKRVKPQYQKEYGKVYSKSEAKEVGNKVAGKVKAMQKAESGTQVKKGGQGAIMILAKKIRKDGEKWTDAVKRAGQQLK